jgi:hypothetical protein
MTLTENEMRWCQILKSTAELYKAAAQKDTFEVLVRVQEIEIIARAIQSQEQINSFHEK